MPGMKLTWSWYMIFLMSFLNSVCQYFVENLCISIHSRARGIVNIGGIKVTRNTTHLSILALNVNGLSAPIKRHRIENQVKKTRPNHMLLTRDTSH
jgi:hypothetical protein